MCDHEQVTRRIERGEPPRWRCLDCGVLFTPAVELTSGPAAFWRELPEQRAVELGWFAKHIVGSAWVKTAPGTYVRSSMTGQWIAEAVGKDAIRAAWRLYGGDWHHDSVTLGEAQRKADAALRAQGWALEEKKS